MNHCVPDFDMDEDYSIPNSSSSLNRSKKTAMGDEDIMELLWQDGQVVVQSQNQRSFKKPLAGSSGAEGEIPTQQQSADREIRSMENDTMAHHQQQQQQQQQLFMHEDEMVSWLHYPIDDTSFDRDIYSDLLYPPLSASVSTTTTIPGTSPREIRTTITEIRQLPPPPPSAPVSPSPRPPIPPPPKCTAVETAAKFQNFTHFSRLPKTRIEPGLSSSSKAAKESTVVESNDTPSVGPESRVSQAADSTAEVPGGNVGCGATRVTAAPGTSTAGRDFATACELTVTSSPGGSGGSVSASVVPPPIHKPIRSTAEDRKRKGSEPEDAECQSEAIRPSLIGLYIEFESAEGKKQARGSTSTKRSRAAEVHNLSERRRRDRINEKMKALQELIPRCNKSDKASMLDEAIEYLKSLQLQVQMMSMGCGMIPVMYPGVQQYMPAMGMGMDMGINRPMMTYPSLIPCSGMPIPPGAANMGPRFPVPAFHMQPIPVPDPSRIRAASQLDPMLSSLIANNPNQPRVPNFSDPYQQFMGLHQAQMSIPRSQVVSQPLSNKPSSSRDVGNPENQQTG